MQPRFGLLMYGIGTALPIAFAVISNWYLGVWGFSFPLDPIVVLVILLFTGPFSALFFIFGYRLRAGPNELMIKGN